MSCHNKILEETSRYITSLLFLALEECQAGNIGVAEGMGLNIELLRSLDQLRPELVPRVAANYVRGWSTLKSLNFDSSRLRSLVESAYNESKTQNLVDEYLRHGACKVVMAEFFGWRSVQVAGRKKLLKIHSSRGRLKITTVDEQRRVFSAWKASGHIEDIRERVLYIAITADVTVTAAYREIREISEVQAKYKNKVQNIYA